jgi:hypothetical protein
MISHCRTSALIRSLSVSLGLSLLVGCSLSPSMTDAPTQTSVGLVKGNVHGGQQPIAGAHVYVFAAGTLGYGGASTSLLNNVPGSTTVDGNGNYYVTSGSDGSFALTGNYSCVVGTQLYVYSIGGNTGSGVNSAAGLLATLGACPAGGTLASRVPFVWINEVSTVASAYSFAGFATDATHVSSSGTSRAQVGIANAFVNATNLANVATGNALALTPAGNGTVPAAEINSLANTLAACVNTNSPTSTPCTTLFNNARSAGATGTAPAETATAIINIAHNPGNAVATLYGVGSAVAPFQPALASAPNDWTIALIFIGAGLTNGNRLAIDSAGSAWATNIGGTSLAKFSSQGAPVSPSIGFTGGGLNGTGQLAIDDSGNVWVVNTGNDTVSEFTNSGGVLNASLGSQNLVGAYGVAIDPGGNAMVSGRTSAKIVVFASNGGGTGAFDSGGGLLTPQGVALDISSNLWAANNTANSLSEFNSTGSALSSTAGYTGGSLNQPGNIAMDGGGNVWVTNLHTGPSKFTSTGVPIAQTGDIAAANAGGGGLSIDGLGNVWVTPNTGNGIVEFSNAGTKLTPSAGYLSGLTAPVDVVIDASGDLWSTGGNKLAEFIGVGAPAITPLVDGVINHSLGTRP